jgi:hypothetical protein
MKARCFIIGNPVTAQKLLAAGGAAVGLHLPTKILVPDGKVHVAHDRLPLMAPSGNDALSTVASKIDEVLEGLARVATEDELDSDDSTPLGQIEAAVVSTCSETRMRAAALTGRRLEYQSAPAET